MPTGDGKSLCYQIPALCRPGVDLVVSPLIPLMRNQVDILSQLGVRAAALNSSLSWSEKTKIKAALRTGKLDLLYVAPERLLMPDILEALQEPEIAVIQQHCGIPDRDQPSVGSIVGSLPGRPARLAR